MSPVSVQYMRSCVLVASARAGGKAATNVRLEMTDMTPLRLMFAQHTHTHTRHARVLAKEWGCTSHRVEAACTALQGVMCWPVACRYALSLLFVSPWSR